MRMRTRGSAGDHHGTELSGRSAKHRRSRMQSKLSTYGSARRRARWSSGCTRKHTTWEQMINTAPGHSGGCTNHIERLSGQRIARAGFAACGCSPEPGTSSTVPACSKTIITGKICVMTAFQISPQNVRNVPRDRGIRG